MFIARSRLAWSTLMMLILGLTACGSREGLLVIVEWEGRQPALQEDLPVHYGDFPIGRVVEVEETLRGVHATVSLRSKYAHYVRADSTFVVREAKEGSPAHVAVSATKPDSPPIADGMRLLGVNDSWTNQLPDIGRDQWVWIVAGAAALVGLVIMLRVLAWSWRFFLAAFGAGVVAYFGAPYVIADVASVVGSHRRPDIVAYAVVFIAALLLLSLLLRMLFGSRTK